MGHCILKASECSFVPWCWFFDLWVFDLWVFDLWVFDLWVFDLWVFDLWVFDLWVWAVDESRDGPKGMGRCISKASECSISCGADLLSLGL
jgi:hypothetical protein